MMDTNSDLPGSELPSRDVSGSNPLQPPVGKESTEVDAAAAALNRMRLAAQGRGEIRSRAGRAIGTNKTKSNKRNNFLALRDTGRDPLGLGSVVKRLVSERGWSSPVAVGSVMAQWDVLVGANIAAHCQPESFTETTLQVRCDSTSWATQLRLLSDSLVAKFDAELGSGVVTKIQVLGPVAPNWRKGYRSVKGRGPRDTYG